MAYNPYVITMMKRGGVFLAGANFTGTCKIYGRRDVVRVSIEFSSPIAFLAWKTVSGF